MKYLLISILFICSRVVAQNDTLHIKNTDTVFVQLTISWPDHWSILKDVKSDSTVVMYSERFKLGASLTISSERGLFGSSMKETAMRGNYTLVISWNEKKRAYRTIFRSYQDGD
jgi:hypothetical protein